MKITEIKKRSGQEIRSSGRCEMKLYHSLLAAFSTYSKIPVPPYDWERASIGYTMCFFPLIGAVQGVLFYGLYALMRAAGFGGFMIPAALTALPLLVNGGIHLDGFMDTSDALAANTTKEKRLSILKDSHTGAFAVWKTVLYLIWNTAVYSAFDRRGVCMMAYVFVFSRVFSGLSVVCAAPASRSRMLKVFHDRAYKNATAIVLGIELLALNIICGYFFGAETWRLTGPVVVVFLIYLHMSRSKFGGVTGDLAGWFLQTAELAAATCIALPLL